MIPTAEEFRNQVEMQLETEGQFRLEYERVQRQIEEAITNRTMFFSIRINKFEDGMKKVLEDKGYKLTKTATANEWLLDAHIKHVDLVNIDNIEGEKHERQ